MLDLVFLTEKFYNRYTDCKEIEQKTDRPYARLKLKINGVVWAIPFRSHIKHDNAVWTDKANGCGIDLSKAVVVLDTENYIDKKVPHLRDNEFAALKGINTTYIKAKFVSYMKLYLKAKEHQNIPRNRNIVRYSTLQYFEEYIFTLPTREFDCVWGMYYDEFDDV